MTTDIVSTTWTLRAAPPGAHIGLIVLDCDQTTEPDFMAMRPDGVSFYTTRVRYDEANTLENLLAVGERLGEAAALILPAENLDAIAYSCTSGTVALGHDGVCDRIWARRPGIPVVTPMMAAFAAFERLGVRKVSLLTPYRAEVADRVADAIAARGYEVLNAASFMLPNSSDLQRLEPDAIAEAAVSVCHADADGLFISCTGIRSVETIARIEAALAKPVITSNQCMFWQCLGHAGFEGGIRGFGRLFDTDARDQVARAS